jgi:hypothetical protein
MRSPTSVTVSTTTLRPAATASLRTIFVRRGPLGLPHGSVRWRMMGSARVRGWVVALFEGQHRGLGSQDFDSCWT